VHEKRFVVVQAKFGSREKRGSNPIQLLSHSRRLSRDNENHFSSERRFMNGYVLVCIHEDNSFLLHNNNLKIRKVFLCSTGISETVPRIFWLCRYCANKMNER
jgi:hypothetical protein